MEYKFPAMSYINNLKKKKTHAELLRRRDSVFHL